MVGAKPKRISIYDFTKRMIDLQYDLGRLDCFMLAYMFIKEKGVDLPNKIGTTTLENYPELFKEDPNQAIKVMLEFITKHLEEIPHHKAFAGDILLLKLRNSNTHPFLAIHGGNSNIVSVTEKYGVRATPIKHYTVERVFRCHKRCQY